MNNTDSSSDGREEIFEEAREKAAAEIHERARLYSESRVYRLNNQYLDERQRVDVEMWFVAPVEIFYAGAGILLLMKQTLVSSILISSVISIVLMEYFFWNANSNLFSIYHLFVLRAVKSHILTLALFICASLFAGTSWWASLLMITVYLLTAFSPSIITSVVLHGKKMHPKYEFAKRRFGVQYPWDTMDV
jgi:hypothetical protein